MINIDVYCSTCGKEFAHPLNADNVRALNLESIKARIEALAPWVVQINGDNVDTYCSKQCAQ